MNENYNNKRGKLQFLLIVLIAILYSVLVFVTGLPKRVSATEKINIIAIEPLNVDVEKVFKLSLVQEDPLEQEKITEALIEQGYYRTDVPLSYELQDILHCTCDKYDVDYELALGLIQSESNFDVVNDSETNICYGLMALSKKYFPKDLTPAENIEAGIKCFSEKIEKYNGDIEAALTAYNVGHDNGSRHYAKRALEFAKSWGYEI